jgi:hypothetical protein
MYEQDRKALADRAFSSEKAFLKKLMQIFKDFEFDEVKDPITQVVDHFYVMLYQMNLFVRGKTDHLAGLLLVC